jgi:hypothetical protein
MSRRPEHWEDEAPNEPEPQSFLRQHPPAVWWIMAGLGVLVVIGLTAAWLTQRESDEPNTTEDPAVAGAREESHETRLTDGGFDPASLDIPRNQTLVVVNESGEACRLTVTAGEEGVPPGEDSEEAPPGGQATWTAEEPGQYIVGCEGSEHSVRVTVP